METQNTLNSQNNLEKKEQISKNHAPWLQSIPQSYSDQNSMAKFSLQVECDRSHLGGAGWGEQVGQGGFSGERQGRAHGVRWVDGEWQKCHLPVPGQLGGRREKQRKTQNKPKEACQCFHPWRKLQQIPALPAHMLKVVSDSPSHMTQVLFKLWHLHWDWEQMSLCASPSRALLGSHSPWALPEVSPTVFQIQMLWGLIFQVQVHWDGELNLALRILTLQGHLWCCCLIRGVGSDYTASLPLLPVSIWPFLCILGCRISVLLFFR